MGRHADSSFFHADMRRNTQKDKDIGTQQPLKGWQTKRPETENPFCVFQRFLREITTPFPSERNYQKLFQKKLFSCLSPFSHSFGIKKIHALYGSSRRQQFFSRRYAQKYAERQRHWHTTNPEGVADFRQGCSAAKPLQTTTYTENPEGVADKKIWNEKIFSAYFSDFCVKYHLLPVFRQSQ